MGQRGLLITRVDGGLDVAHVGQAAKARHAGLLVQHGVDVGDGHALLLVQEDEHTDEQCSSHASIEEEPL